MSEARTNKKKERATPTAQQNVTIISEDGGRKVLSQKEYQEYLNPKKEEVN